MDIWYASIILRPIPSLSLTHTHTHTNEKDMSGGVIFVSFRKMPLFVGCCSCTVEMYTPTLFHIRRVITCERPSKG
jgi:hypothetical protein